MDRWEQATRLLRYGQELYADDEPVNSGLLLPSNLVEVGVTEIFLERA